MDNSVIIGGWIAAGLTLFMFSSLYKDNPFFRFGEHLYLGLSIGYILTITIYNSVIPKWYEPLFLHPKEQWYLIFPSILGLMLYTRFFAKWAWISRITFAFLIGYYSGLNIPRVIAGGILQQLDKFMSPLLTDSNTFAYFSSVLLVIGIFSVLIYFFFSLEHKGVVGGISKVGIYFVMIAFGASFGYTVMGRMSLLIGRCYDLIDFAQPNYYYATIILVVLMVLILIFYETMVKKDAQKKENNNAV